MNPTSVQAAEPPPTSRLALAALPGSVRTARRHVHDLLHRWELPHLIETAELVVSELSTNAIRATGIMTDSPGYGELTGGLNAICVSLHVVDSRAVIEVWDASPSPPHIKDADPDDEGGRGLFLVEALTTRWGFRRPETGGKVVWAEIKPG
ncbi:ATP-binding protein [Sphaerisporangium sp. NPDC049002]|uniref:ATP-binding protein n=1 Tax=Sphaerisporangium sp. NPDC049002 TaxID=3155392 RepID=UPI0033D2D3B9